MANKDINSKELKNIITEMESGSTLYTLLPISWGFWNAMACILSILKIYADDLVWMTMIGCGIISHFIIFATHRKVEGFILKIDNMTKWYWIILTSAVLNICFILPKIHRFFDTEYSLIFVIILIGSGIIFSGVMYKMISMIILGILWVIAANITTAFIGYKYHTYLILIIITLIIRPLIWHFFERGKYNVK